MEGERSHQPKRAQVGEGASTKPPDEAASTSPDHLAPPPVLPRAPDPRSREAEPGRVCISARLGRTRAWRSRPGFGHRPPRRFRVLANSGGCAYTYVAGLRRACRGNGFLRDTRRTLVPQGCPLTAPHQWRSPRISP